MSNDPLANITTTIYQCIGGPHDGRWYNAGIGVMPTMTIEGARYELTRRRRCVSGHYIWETVLLSADLNPDEEGANA